MDCKSNNYLLDSNEIEVINEMQEYTYRYHLLSAVRHLPQRFYRAFALDRYRVEDR